MDQSIFREYDIRGIVGKQLDSHAVLTIARAIGTYFIRNGAQRIAVGYDARESSPGFHQALIAELTGAGCDVLDIGRVPTPVLYFALFTEDVDGGVMITASHNPPDHNGFKISLGKESLYGEQIQEIKEIALLGRFAKGDLTVKISGIRQNGKIFTTEWGNPQVKVSNVLEAYQKQLLRRISLVESNLKVVVDAGNGMGGITAPALYRRLGVEVIELFCQPDSSFPNHEADPSQEKNLQDLIKSVRENKADLGIAFDGDGDRITIIDETGSIIWGDELMLLLSREVLREHPGSTIIAEVKCTQRLFDEIENLGGKSIMSKAGYAIIKAEMRRTGALLGGEMSGHIFFTDRFYGFDDACYTGARVLEILSKTNKTLSEIFAEFPPSFSTPEIRIKCTEEQKTPVLQKTIEFFSADQEVITIDGARIKFANGWGLVRPSNTQAILTLRFEADTPENLQKIREMVENKVESFL